MRLYAKVESTKTITKARLHTISTLTSLSLQCNTNVTVTADGGQLSNDAGLVLFQEFLHRINFRQLANQCLKLPDQRRFWKASMIDIFLEKLLLDVAGYLHDSSANDWQRDPVLAATLGSSRLVSQPSLSRFFKRLEDADLDDFRKLIWQVAALAFRLSGQSRFVLDIDSTHCDTFGNQERSAFNAHYMAYGYHPQVVFDQESGLLLDALMRPGNEYTGKEADKFVETTFSHLSALPQSTSVIIRGDSGFAAPKFYEMCDTHGVDFLVRLKANSKLGKLAETALVDCPPKYEESKCVYHEFKYQAASWGKARRVIVCSTHTADELVPWNHAFVVTSLASEAPETLFKTYRQRGNAENQIKELKCGFGFDKTDSSTFARNTARALITGIAYNLVQLFKQLFVSEDRRSTISSLRFSLFHIAGRITWHARRVVIHLASNYVYKNWFSRLMDEVHQLAT
ncbi:IS1380 family transposase [Lacticaseibacillus rhamnosus]|uniref:IS1380 family transposase n=1 Tax=Lacticaseibacillus rhamnosus TaxID=47715 RepID=UPI001CDA5D82|nr:IS1380 family transposase [Lacticaseibacillus rhamnosus]